MEVFSMGGGGTCGDGGYWKPISVDRLSGLGIAKDFPNSFDSASQGPPDTVRFRISIWSGVFHHSVSRWEAVCLGVTQVLIPAFRPR